MMAVGLQCPTEDLRPAGSGFRATCLGRAGSHPAPGEATAGWLLSTETTNVLIDCGAGVLSNLLRVLPPQRLDAIVITHAHPDHISDLTVLTHLLRYGSWRADFVFRELPVYAPTEPDALLDPLLAREGISRRPLTNGVDTKIGDLRFTFAPTQHPTECFAVRAQHADQAGGFFVYTADTGPEAELTDFAAHADVLVAEATLPEAYSDGAARIGHLTPSLAAELAVRSGAKRLLLTHLVMGFDPAPLVAAAEAAAKRIAAATNIDQVPDIEAAELLHTYQIGR